MSKTYFASDFHLGVSARLTSAEREQQIVRWLLEVVSRDATALYLVGDVFDYWFEYRRAVPKGFTRLLGALATLRDGGLPIHFFTGNHDMWMFRYLTDEMGIPIHRHPITLTIDEKKIYIGHGDGLGPGDYGYKFIKRIFANPAAQWLFERVHPNAGLGLMQFFSGKSRDSQPDDEYTFLGETREWLLEYCRIQSEQAGDAAVDFYIFGHRHLPIDWLLPNQRSRYVNLGEWLHFNSYAVLENGHLKMQSFENQSVRLYSNHLPNIIEPHLNTINTEKTF